MTNEMKSPANIYKIGKAADLAGVNKETIRYCERRGLIPESTRRCSGYRILTKRHINQIKFVKRTQEVGFTLSEIKELLELRLSEDTTCSDIKREAQSKYQDVNEKIEDMKRIKDTLIKLIVTCDGEGPKG